jgi:hypothetical protein
MENMPNAPKHTTQLAMISSMWPEEVWYRVDLSEELQKPFLTTGHRGNPQA